MQEINKPLDISINNHIHNVSNSCRYNQSNWFCVNPTQDEYDSTGDIGEIMLSTFTRRGVIIIITPYIYGEPGYKYSISSVGCAIPGDFEHTINQRSDGLSSTATAITFDFSVNEVVNGINVTNEYGVPVNGLFTLKFYNETTQKEVTRFPPGTLMKFIMVGKWVSWTETGSLSYRFPVSEAYFDMMERLMYGPSVRIWGNNFAMENGLLFPQNLYTARNFVIPKQVVNLVNNDNFSSYKIRYYPTNDKARSVVNGSQQCWMYGVDPVDSHCSTTHSHTFERITGVTHMSNIRHSSKKIYSFDFYKDFEFILRDGSGTELDLPFSNILVMQPSSDIIKGFLPPEHWPSLPIKIYYGQYPYTNMMSNYFENFNNMYFNENLKNIALKWTRSYQENPDGMNGVLINTIEEFPPPMEVVCYNMNPGGYTDLVVDEWGDLGSPVYINYRNLLD